MENYNGNVLFALITLRSALKDYDTEFAHHLLLGPDCDLTEQKKEECLDEYLVELDKLIEQTIKNYYK